MRIMTIGVTLPSGDTAAAPNLVDELLAQARQAADAGLKSVWFSQLPLSQDAITVAALAGRENPGLEVGTSVVPIYPRHPLVVANAAQTAHAATGGRFTLGVGLGSKGFLGPVYGVEYPPPIKHLREYLTVLKQVFTGEAVDFDGETVQAHAPGLSTVGGDVPIIVAAMGPQALRVTGELADGTLPFLAGPRALAEQIVPHLPAGKRILAAVPAIVTNEPDAVRALAVEQMGFYAQIPSYQRILAAEGVDHPADLAIIGDEKTVLAGLRRYYDAGATDVLVSQTGIRSSEERRRTWEVISSIGS